MPNDGQRDSLALSEREAQLNAILQTSDNGIYGLDLAGDCTFANDACAELLGYSDPSVFIGQNMHALIHHSKADGSELPLGQCQLYMSFREGDPVHIDGEYLWKKDGTSFPAECWASPIRRGDESIGAVVTFVDISDRHERELAQDRTQRQLEDEIDESRSKLAQVSDRLALALTRANIGLWDWDAVTNEVYYSPTFKTQLGYSADADFRDFESWRSRLHPEDVEGALSRVDEYFQQQTDHYRSTFRMRCADGSYRWILAQGKGDFDAEGKPTRVMGVHIDITDRIAGEEELKRLNIELADTNKALTESNTELQQFASVASHDLQAPLRSIAGFAQCLQDDYGGQLDDLADDYIGRIVRSAGRMQRLITDLLDFSRVESRAEPHEPTQMNDVFDDAIALLDETIESKHAVVTRDDLPAVVGDPTQLCQLFRNLVDNAIKYHEGNLPRVHVSVKRDGDNWTFSVKDNGIGIEPEHQDRIFEIFRRLHTQAVYSGSGIGLALCRRIVYRHEGQIWVESKPRQGSTFFFTLPARML